MRRLLGLCRGPRLQEHVQYGAGSCLAETRAVPHKYGSCGVQTHGTGIPRNFGDSDLVRKQNGSIKLSPPLNT